MFYYRPDEYVAGSFFRLVHRDIGDGKNYEIVLASNSASGLVHLVDTAEVMLVQQQRPSMRGLTDAEGTLIELVAGRFDHPGESPIDLFVREAAEEIGAHIRPDQVTVLNNGQPMAVSAGLTDELSYLCYAAITSDQLNGSDKDTFGTDADERITRLRMTVHKFLQLTTQCVRVFALQQYLRAEIYYREATFGRDR